MTNLVVIFLTGLTTGGLSCLAVQGGLLASSVAHQAEQSIQKQLKTKAATRHVTKKGKNQPLPKSAVTGVNTEISPSLISPILLFLGAKLIAYTLLGFLLGWVGSMLQLTPFMRAVLQLVIGVFMLGTALRMLNVHPIFRYFALEPPTFVTRYIRRTAKGGAHAITPLFLGALTVLIPCGITQAMMALAIGAGHPLEGAAIMFAFTLGASPVFFGLAYLATQLGQKLEARFVQIIGLVVFVLGLVSIDGGLALLGAPFTISRATNAMTSAPASTLPSSTTFATVTPPTQAQPEATIPSTPQPLIHPTVAPAQAQPTPLFNPVVVGPQSFPDDQPAVDAAEPAGPANVLNVNVLDYGYNPPISRAQAEQSVQLNLTTNNTYGCTRAFVIPALNLFQVLPTTGVTTLEIPPQPAGSVLYYTCSMGMFSGQIEFIN